MGTTKTQITHHTNTCDINHACPIILAYFIHTKCNGYLNGNPVGQCLCLACMMYGCKGRKHNASAAHKDTKFHSKHLKLFFTEVEK